ncbi:hypothetical protein LOZ53_005915 [Ophidiomyces ophidiicola]|uniref:Uncharacterized protein n=1 Tax=Ophidiomyces ophidiicola TaxID=1387563 RepID=A0ACB8V4H8_9EURO|nr:uncharacterized protein LOZ57_000135 [Ophidiomyces ophidiicola]KAI1906170.1 hypothetical protein LOZ64_006380 [Ophidiomyces ophidiicola]KAI1906387.1 hypothetical protein LOZ61_006705 [Ophidiomyces ophidiicola]KAI1920919.1 hypothetical protein LOZ60_006405 [Ophidiomyces ophidiicola]KAI1953794.1 hypothetical protein LOZ57_000135 [Ophidiomyces ophidiicola]KAI1954796.1 hypothetical protein LOZ62_000573 [Ophidiomyces ophidiicola]
MPMDQAGENPPPLAARKASSSSDTPEPADDQKGGRIAHTLTACTRCRQRKSRCDTGIPRCTPCQRSNSKCVYFDPAKNATIPRTYIVQLRDKVRRLSEELAQLESQIEHSPDPEMMVRGGGLIKFKENDESRFLGPSSGIAITRFVMEMAKQNTDTKSIKEVVNESTAQEIKHVFTKESQKPTSKIYPLISSVAQPDLPERGLCDKLVDLFMAKAQYMLPTLHEPSFRQEVDAVYNGSDDPCQNFQLRIVIAISMQKLNTQFAGLADAFYLAALQYLDACIKKMDTSTLQCLVLIGQYSLLTPTRTAAYWVVGAAVKLCQDLRLTDETTITRSPSGRPLNCLEIDMRRRLFWIITSMEYGLSHSLGRPSSFCVSHDHINVKFFEMVDDRYITTEGVAPEARPIMKKCIAIHFLKMRLLQAEIRRTLYLRKRETPNDDQDPWFAQMLDKLDNWVTSCPKNDEGSGLSQVWFEGRRNTMIVFMYRPSPQVPEPSLQAAQRCYDACVFNIKMHKEQVRTGSVDLTWIWTQSVCMALNTILWSLSYPDIRQEHPKEEVVKHINVAMEVLAVSAERWPGVESCRQLYISLIAGCLKAYGSDESFVVQSPSNRPSPASTQDVTTPQQQISSPDLNAVPNLRPPDSTYAFKRSATVSSEGSHVTHDSYEHTYPIVSQPSFPSYPSAVPTPPQPLSNSMGNHSSSLADTQFFFDPTSFHNSIPSVVPGLQNWDANYMTASTMASHLSSGSAAFDPMVWTGSFGDQYSQFFNQSYPSTVWRDRNLSREEQSELMANLVDELPDVSYLINESTTFYNAMN